MLTSASFRKVEVNEVVTIFMPQEMITDLGQTMACHLSKSKDLLRTPFELMKVDA